MFARLLHWLTWPLTAILLALIRLYQLLLSPILPSRCRFHPTCSRYGMEALRKHGFFKGSYRTARRILRCHPWTTGGFDPVPVLLLTLGASLLAASCSSSNSAAAAAQRFCTCSKTLVEGKIQREQGRLDAEQYAAIQNQHQACLGKENPLAAQKTHQDSLIFMRDFVAQLYQHCPELARELGFAPPKAPQ